MAVTIFYFTSTGNSLQIARDLVNKIENSKLIPIVGAMHKEEIVPDSNVVGFVFPQHSSGLPRIVREFIEKFSFPHTHKIFAVVTCMHPRGLSLEQLNQLLVKKNRILNAGFYVPMPVNFIIGYNPPPLEIQHQIMKDANEKLHEIVTILSQKERYVEKVGFPAKTLARISTVYRTRLESIRTLDYNFHVTESCNACGTCEMVCPVDNIKLIDEVPTWYHQCEQCLSCINLCPNQAIEYGMETKGRNRYLHPEISISDIIAQKERL